MWEILFRYVFACALKGSRPQAENLAKVFKKVYEISFGCGSSRIRCNSTGIGRMVTLSPSSYSICLKVKQPHIESET